MMGDTFNHGDWLLLPDEIFPSRAISSGSNLRDGLVMKSIFPFSFSISHFPPGRELYNEERN